MDQPKLFWLLVAALGILADLVLPLVWGLIATVPILFVSWWIVYRSDWFGQPAGCPDMQIFLGMTFGAWPAPAEDPEKS